ncbi:hypothetical protein G9A89_010852 [Geosiphon pyriformis]|nr:hypothetical protein G9A89_010852 [Geosiphon pyriformis]
MEIPDHIHTIAQQLFQTLSKQQLDMEIVINNQIICYQNNQKKTKNTPYQRPPKNNKNWTDNLREKVKNTFGKISVMVPTEELMKENWKQWTERLPISYCYYQLGQKLNIQELYINKSKKIFNQDIIQQIKKFIRKKTNSTLHIRTIYRLYNIFQNYPKVLLYSDIETITINQWGRMNNTQVEDMRNRVEQTILEKEVLELIQNEDFNGAQY